MKTPITERQRLSIAIGTFRVYFAHLLCERQFRAFLAAGDDVAAIRFAMAIRRDFGLN